MQKTTPFLWFDNQAEEAMNKIDIKAMKQAYEG